MGMILDGIAGAASQGLSIMNDRDKVAASEASTMRMEAYREDLAAKRAETVAALKRKTEMEDAEIEQGQYDQIEAGAKQIGSNRDIGTAKSRAPSMDQAALDAVRENLSPEDQAKFYGIQQQKQSGLINDRMTAARDIGARPGIRKELAGEYKTTLDAEKASTLAAFKEKQLDQRYEIEQARLTESGRKTDLQNGATIAAINARGNGGGSNNDGKITREERLRYTTLFSDAGKRLSEAQTALSKVAPGRMGEADRASLQESIAAYKEERALYQGLLAESQAPAGKPAAPTPQSNDKPKAKPNIAAVKGAPAGANVGALTSKGWEVKDAKGKVIGHIKE